MGYSPRGHKESDGTEYAGRHTLRGLTKYEGTVESETFFLFLKIFL